MGEKKREPLRTPQFLRCRAARRVNSVVRSGSRCSSSSFALASASPGRLRSVMSRLESMGRFIAQVVEWSGAGLRCKRRADFSVQVTVDICGHQFEAGQPEAAEETNAFLFEKDQAILGEFLDGRKAEG